MISTDSKTNIQANIQTNIINHTDSKILNNISSNACKLAVQEAQNMKGQDIILLDVAQLTPLSDYILIITGTSSTHCKAITENIRVEAKKNEHYILGFESDPQAEWSLIDLGDVIIHVMQENAREYYALEKLWRISLDKAEVNRDTSHQI